MFFDFGHYTYFALLAFTLAYPLAQSFEWRLKYYTQWKYLWPGMLATALFFITLDAFYTHLGVWAFNEKYITGLYLGNLPLEECLFFICVPFACVFIYECIGYFFKPDVWQKAAKLISILFIILCFVIAFANVDRFYTLTKVLGAAVFLIGHYIYFGNRILGKFYLSFLFTIIPFMFVNGVLTNLPVVTYNENEIIGLRFSHLLNWYFPNMPIEDLFYCFMLLLMNISFFEYTRSRMQTVAKLT